MEILGNPWWTYALLGLAAGVLSGTLGVGSGAIMVPALVLIMALPQKGSQGTSLALMVPMALVGALRYSLDPDVTVSPAAVALLAAGAVPGALLGSELAQRLPAAALRRLFAAFLVIVGLRMALPSSAILGGILGKLGLSEGTDSTHSSGVEEGGAANVGSE
ncbi:MAG: sulfite exporter TauE/SafE family protein [Planctomycetota bacterium]